MDQLTQVQSNVHGNYTGNAGNENVFGNNNIVMKTYLAPNVINFGAGNPSGEFGARDAVSRLYRLIPYGRNSKFTGRKNLIESVKRVSERKGHNRVALYGLGGSGKTQIALEYVYQRASESDCSIFWVQGSGLLKFGEGFRAIAQHVRIPLVNVEKDEEDRLQGIRKWFEGPHSGDWILVIDNADNEADFDANNSPIAKFIPQCTKGTLVFTTRSWQVASRQGCEMIEVGKMGEEEAVELFSKRFGSWGSLADEEKMATAIILDSLQYLPLAVVGSAAFMIETATPPSAYWAIFQENEERMRKLLHQQFCDIQREADVTESILGTYFLTFDRITQQAPLAANLLRLMAFFDRQNIPEELLRQCDLEGMDDSVEFRRAIGKLLAFSLVTLAKCEDKTFYQLHRLVQLSLQVYLPIEDLNQDRAAALQVVSRLFPRDQDELRHAGPTYIQHALAVTKDSNGPVAEELCYRMGLYFLDVGSYNNAESQFRRCIALREEGNEHNWDDEGHWRFICLAQVKADQGKYDEAETMNRSVLERCEKALGSDHPDTLASVHTLASALWYQGKYGESEKMMRRALDGYEKLFGSDHPTTLACVDTLAITLKCQGKYDESEKIHRHALEGREKVLGPDHPDTLISVNNLAFVLQDQGKYDESEKMIRRALEGSEKALGPDHPGTLTCVDTLASALLYQGQYDESEKINRRALEGREKVLGPDHPGTLESVHNLALVLHEQGKYDESENMNRRALERREEVLGPDHPETLRSVNTLALVLRSQRKYAESEKMNRRALEGRERVLGPNHPDTLASANNLAATLRDQEASQESEAMNRHTQSSLPGGPARTRSPFPGRRVLRFFKTVLSNKGDRPKK